MFFFDWSTPVWDSCFRASARPLGLIQFLSSATGYSSLSLSVSVSRQMTASVPSISSTYRDLFVHVLFCLFFPGLLPCILSWQNFCNFPLLALIPSLVGKHVRASTPCVLCAPSSRLQPLPVSSNPVPASTQ